MANIYLGQFNGASTSYGNYNGYFQYDDATRNGTTITLTNCKLYFERIGSGYTTNRIATTGNIAGKVSWDNITLNSSGSQSPASMTHDIGKVEITDVPFTTDKISLKVQAKGTGGSTSWGNTSGTVQLDYNGTISVPVINISAVTATNTNIGGETNITITRYNSNFTHKLYYKFDGQSDYSLIAEGITTNYKWVVPESVYSLIPNSNAIGCTIKCETYNVTTSMGESTTNFTATVIDSNPEFDSDKVSYKDGNASSVEITNNNQLIVRNISELNVIIASATPKNYATITGYELVFNGNTQTVQAGTKNMGTVNLSQDTTLVVRAVDSRGNKTELTKTVTISDWILPQAQIIAKRINNFEDNTNLKANITISSVQGINAIQSIKYRYKKVTDAIYSNYYPLQNNENLEVIIDKLYAWNFQVEIKDKFGIITYNFVVQTGLPIMFIDIAMLSVGIGKFPINPNSLDLDTLNGKNVLDLTHPVGTIYETLSDVNPSILFGGTWLKLTDKFLIGAGSSYLNGTTGGSTLLQSHSHNGTTVAGGSHNHNINFDQIWSFGGTKSIATTSGGPYSGGGYIQGSGEHLHSFITNNTGGGNSENMPPFIGAYMWYRSA